MTQPVHLRENYFSVEVPEDAHHIEFSFFSQCVWWCRPGFSTPQKGDGCKLTPGNWQIVCTSKNVTEEQAASIVQIISTGKINGRPQYRRYDRGAEAMPSHMWTRDARHSFETLLRSLNLNGYQLILKKL